jgi:prepilin-type N-terminal cleavage/methylation domain-containing protein
VGGARGFTLIEVLIAVAVVVMIAGGGVGAAMGARSLAVSSAATEFDALLDAARTTAREFDGGATLVFEPDAYGDGFTARVYGRRPSTGPLLAIDMPSYDGRITLSETNLLGTPAFALALHANGKIGGIRGDVVAGSAGPENACPATGAYQLVFSYGGAKATRTIPCTIALATTGTIAYVSPPAASPLPAPTANLCITTGCLNTPPAEPTIITTCPPGYTMTGPTSCSPSTATPATTATPSSSATCPPGFMGTPPDCKTQVPPTPTATPSSGIAESVTTIISILVCGVVGPGTQTTTTSTITAAQFDSEYAAAQNTTFAPYSYAEIATMDPETEVALTVTIQTVYKKGAGPICS